MSPPYLSTSTLGLAITVLLTSPALAQQSPTFLGDWGKPGTGPGEFDTICNVAIDASGDVYVGDEQNHRIQKFTAGGEFVLSWSVGSNRVPEDIAIDSENRIWVLMQKDLVKYATSGEELSDWPHGGLGVAVDANGFVYIARHDTTTGILKLDPNGTPILEWGREGYHREPGEFEFPRDVAVDRDGNVYVTERYVARVQKFDSSGNFLADFSAPEPNVFGLSGLCIDGDEVLVAALDDNRILVYSTAGAFRFSWGTSGSGDGEFNGPCDVAIGDTGLIYVTERYNSRVDVFATTVPVDRTTWGKLKARYR